MDRNGNPILSRQSIEFIRTEAIDELRSYLTTNPIHLYTHDRNDSLLSIATRFQYPEMIDLLMEMGCPHLHSTTTNKYTLVHEAVLKMNASVLRTLIKWGITLDSKTIYGHGSLHIAAEYGFTEIVVVLLRFGSQDLHVGIKGGWVPLHWACCYQRWSTVEALLRFNPDVNQKTDFDGTPLSITLSQNHYNLDIGRMLIAFGADLDPILDRLIISIRNKKQSWQREFLANVKAPFSEQEILNYRYRVYFRSSLFEILLSVTF